MVPQLVGWISVNERLPENVGNVMVWGRVLGSKAHESIPAWYSRSDYQWRSAYDDGNNPLYQVTHWMPMPKGPEGETNSGESC